MVTLLTEPDVEELKGSSLLAFNKKKTATHTFSVQCYQTFSSIIQRIIKSELKVWTKTKENTLVCFYTYLHTPED